MLTKRLAMGEIKPDEAFDIAYGALASSDASIECTKCGTCLIGDGPAVPCVCVFCMHDMENGVMMSDATMCFSCSAIRGVDWTKAMPVTNQTHPDGFTCIDCGDCFLFDGV